MRYHIWTEGCQMNVADSQRLASALEALGYEAAEKPEHADVVVLNTCMVRGVYYLMLTEPDYLSSQERERISSDYRLWNVQLDLALAAAEKLTAT